ncbi:hypothetical protein AV530_019757 [Patagioenas fasciata monilis]|uniref:Ig-like domain-containing protein n=1 Tax=Patagioenas fasciata monilis TaxID=372326 RepID=A0A1V4K4P4_PATFA|nr:hypothetical protein AV530_019757 [Patagioenas fasciata monilis]
MTSSVCADEWDAGDVYTCNVTHPELLFPTQVTLQKTPAHDARAPSLYVLPPPPEQVSLRESVTVTCLVTDFNPQDVLVRWLRNGEPLDPVRYVTFPPVPANQGAPGGAYVTYSALRVASEEWGAGNVFTCLVGHERLPMRLAQKSVDRNSGKAAAVNVSLVLADSAAACY